MLPSPADFILILPVLTFFFPYSEELLSCHPSLQAAPEQLSRCAFLHPRLVSSEEIGSIWPREVEVKCRLWLHLLVLSCVI